MILELGSNLYHTLIFLIIAWAITRFLIALTKVPAVPRQTRTRGQEENVRFTK